jgi:hypothetical protein
MSLEALNWCNEKPSQTVRYLNQYHVALLRAICYYYAAMKVMLHVVEVNISERAPHFQH